MAWDDTKFNAEDPNSPQPNEQTSASEYNNMVDYIKSRTGNSDTDVSTNSWVLDEDDMASNDATKVPTQQSVKAYVDANATGITAVVDDTTPELGGDLSLNTYSIVIQQTQTASGDYEAINKFTATAGEALSQFEVVTLQSDGKYDLATADTTANVKGKCAIVLSSSVALGAPGDFSDNCVIKNTGWSFTVGAELYIDPSIAGSITETVPSTSGQQIRSIGIAISSDTIRFNPSNNYFEVA